MWKNSNQLMPIYLICLKMLIGKLASPLSLPVLLNRHHRRHIRTGITSPLLGINLVRICGIGIYTHSRPSIQRGPEAIQKLLSAILFASPPRKENANVSADLKTHRANHSKIQAKYRETIALWLVSVPKISKWCTVQ